jgi:hypothetical protein
MKKNYNNCNFKIFKNNSKYNSTPNNHKINKFNKISNMNNSRKNCSNNNNKILIKKKSKNKMKKKKIVYLFTILIKQKSLRIITLKII